MRIDLISIFPDYFAPLELSLPGKARAKGLRAVTWSGDGADSTPVIDGIATPPPFRWFGVRKLDPDTVFTDALGDVALHIESDLGDVQPASRTRQWFLELRGDFTSIRVSGDGAPPTTLRIPSQFIPPAPDKRVDVTLIYFQSALASTGSYIANVTLDVRVQWIVRLP